MEQNMKTYLNAVGNILANGKLKGDRTGTGTIGVFGYQMHFDLEKGFPAVTTKTLAWKSVVSELLWLLEGSTDERRLAELRYGLPRDELVDKTTIWTANADAQGVALGYENTDTVKELGPVYGEQWRDCNGVDQIAQIIEQIKTDPDSRRIILNAWNVSEIDKMALPPCHALAQFYVVDGKLSCQLYQRSADMFLGVPFNIASYSLLTHMLASITGLKVGEFVWTGGDCHIYQNHMPQVLQQLSRKPAKSPVLVMPEFASLEEVLNSSIEDYVLENYAPLPTIKAEMAV
jgi:thymidylate synthase